MQSGRNKARRELFLSSKTCLGWGRQLARFWMQRFSGDLLFSIKSWSCFCFWADFALLAKPSKIQAPFGSASQTWMRWESSTSKVALLLWAVYCAMPSHAGSYRAQFLIICSCPSARLKRGSVYLSIYSCLWLLWFSNLNEWHQGFALGSHWGQRLLCRAFPWTVSMETESPDEISTFLKSDRILMVLIIFLWTVDSQVCWWR